MKKHLTILFSLLALGLYSQPDTVTIEIDFGGEKPNETHQVEWFEGMTAMMALQCCTTVESYPIKEYIFVGTINDIKTQRAVKAWYYEVNGQNTGRIAFRYAVNSGDVIRWVYKTDVCSPKPKDIK